MEHAVLLIFGLGYAGRAAARAAAACGFPVRGTARVPASAELVPFEQADEALHSASHLLSTVPPDAAGDPVLARYARQIAEAPRLRWIGYMSSTAAYGDREGGWVDEDTPPAPAQERGHRRLAAEAAWSAFADRVPVDIFRIAGIYGPGRSALDELLLGRARRVVKPGHSFSRIHRDDIARAVVAAMRQSSFVAGDGPPPTTSPGPPRPIVDGGPSPAMTEGCRQVRILHLADDEPASASDVIAEAARLLGVAPPPEVPFEHALPGMNPMARSFWSENRKVASRKTQTALGIAWRYPTFREGLRAILDEQRRDDPA
jgi:nucleoside-diphosphate-sugar epimerase